MMGAFGSVDDLDTGSSRANGCGGTSAGTGPVKGLFGPPSVPVELMDFLRAQFKSKARLLGFEATDAIN